MSIFKKTGVRLKRSAIYLWGNILHAFGKDKNLYRGARRSRIVVYHNVCKQQPTKFNTLFVTEKTFEQHLQYYKNYFNVISLDDFYAGRFSDEHFNICLTFDDGLANNYHYVLPLLAKYQVPATFFITAIRDAGFDILWNDFLSIAGFYGPKQFAFKNHTYYKNKNHKYTDSGGNSHADRLRGTGFNEKAALMKFLDTLVMFKQNRQDDDYWLQMTPEQIKALAASPLVSIGAHGYYHNDLAQMPPAKAAVEMVMCKEYLEAITGTEINSIAFPYGAYNNEVLLAACQAGYRQLLATDFMNPDDGGNPDLRERLTINPFISTANQINAIIRGSYA